MDNITFTGNNMHTDFQINMNQFEMYSNSKSYFRKFKLQLPNIDLTLNIGEFERFYWRLVGSY